MVHSTAKCNNHHDNSSKIKTIRLHSKKSYSSRLTTMYIVQTWDEMDPSETRHVDLKKYYS